MSIKKDFSAFLFRGNIVDLAVGVIIGGAFGKIVSAFVDDLVMPLVGALIPGGAWREFAIEPVAGVKFQIGHLVGQTLDFVIVAAVLFFVLIKLVGSFKKREAAAAPAAPSTKNCPECLEAVPLAAKRCKYCTSVLPA
jgi:large conductance mechanosensitive channel